MFCNVCSREINSPFLETVGNQFVCCLSCVGLLESNNEDKCNQCQRPVWKDNYYIIHSKYYCSEKCKIIAVKKYLKKNNKIKNVNIKHIQNEYFTNYSPSKKIKELRKEVRELYNDFKFDESNTIKSSENSSDKKSNDNNLKENSKYNHNYDIIDKNEKFLKICQNNKELFNINNSKKCLMIPNKKPKLKNGINILKNYLINKSPRSLSKKKEISNYKRNRSNFSFDNQDKYIYGNNNIIINPALKYSSIKNCHSMSNINQGLKDKIKLKHNILKYQNKRQKLKTIIIPSSNMPNMNEQSNYCFKNINCCKSLEKDENENYDNIQYDTHNNYTKIDNSFNNHYQNGNICPTFHVITKSNNQLNDKIVYYYGKKYKLIDGSNF